jgi:hypothetical protein
MVLFITNDRIINSYYNKNYCTGVPLGDMLYARPINGIEDKSGKI